MASSLVTNLGFENTQFEEIHAHTRNGNNFGIEISIKALNKHRHRIQCVADYNRRLIQFVRTRTEYPCIGLLDQWNFITLIDQCCM